MRRLYVLFDQRCGLCCWARRWCLAQRAYLELSFIPAGSERALSMFPELQQPGEGLELIAVSDEGGVYRDCQAWIMCLYALEEYRELSIRLAQPMLLPLARRAFSLISKQRPRLSKWLSLVSDDELNDALGRAPSPACDLSRPSG